MTEKGDLLFADDVEKFTELLIVDEADRLKVPGLETVRDIYDRNRLGLVLIGMPGIEKRLARYPQLYSRVGFVHEFRPLSVPEMRFILEHKWQEMRLSLNPEDFTDSEALSTIIRITTGNFRLFHRLFSQIERILEINQLRTVTKEIVVRPRLSRSRRCGRHRSASTGIPGSHGQPGPFHSRPAAGNAPLLLRLGIP